MGSKYILGNKEIVYNWDVEGYTAFRRKFYEAEKNMYSTLQQVISELPVNEGLASGVTECVFSALGFVYDSFQDMFIQKGVYGFSRNMLENDPDYIAKIQQSVLELGYRLNEFTQNADAYRDSEAARRSYRKEGRTRVIGGGFGVEGFIKGAMTAGAINGVTGIAHGLFNAVGNAVTSIQVYSKKMEARGQYKKTIYVAAAVWFEELRKILLKQLGFCVDMNVSEAMGIVSNVVSGKISGNTVQVALLRALECYPYEVNIYKQLIRCLPQEKGDICTFAKNFGFNEDDITPNDTDMVVYGYEAVGFGNEISVAWVMSDSESDKYKLVDVIDAYVSQMENAENVFYSKGNMDFEELNNAISCCGENSGIEPNDVIFLCVNRSSLLNTGGVGGHFGFLMTYDRIESFMGDYTYSKVGGGKRFFFTGLRSIEYSTFMRFPMVSVVLNNGDKTKLMGFGGVSSSDEDVFKDMLEKVNEIIPKINEAKLKVKKGDVGDNISQVIGNLANQLNDLSGCYVGDNIPEKMLGNALKSYAEDFGVVPGDVLFLYNEGNILKPASKGLVVTKKFIVTSRNEKWLFSEMDKIWMEGHKLYINLPTGDTGDIFEMSKISKDPNKRLAIDELWNTISAIICR